MSIGSLIVSLSMRTAEFETDAKRAAKIAEKRAKEIDAAFYKLGASIGVAMVAGTAALAAGVSKAVEEVDKLNDMSVKFGIDLTSLQELKYTAGQTGTDIDALAKGVQRLSKTMSTELAGGKTAFDKLGISVSDTGGKLKGATEILPEIADKFAAMQDPMAKAALAQELFGKAGADLIPLLNQGGAGLREYAERAHQLGLILSDDTVSAIAEFDDKLQDLQAVSDAFFGKLAGEVTPILSDVIDDFIEWATTGDNLRDIIEAVTAVVRVAVDAFRLVVSVGGAVADVLGGLMGAFNGVGESADDTGATVARVVKNIADSVRWAIEILKGLGYAVASAGNAATGNLQGANYYNALVGQQQQKMQAIADNSRYMDNAERVASSDPRLKGFVSTGVKAEPAVADFSMPTGGGGGRLRPAPRRSGGGSGGKSDLQREMEKQEAERKRLLERSAADMKKWAVEIETAAMLPMEKAYHLLTNEINETVAAMEKAGNKSEDIKKFREEGEKFRDWQLKYAQTEAKSETYGQAMTDMQDEIELLGVTRTELEKLVATRKLEADAKARGVILSQEEKDAYAALFDQMQQTREMREMFDAFGGSVLSAFDAIIDGSKSVSQAIGDMLQDMAKMIMRFMAQKAVEALVDGLFGAAKSGGFGGFFSRLFGGQTYETFAKGGAFANSPSLSAYSGQIVSKPTLFAFANGAGLMGEAGPEAILPLSRGADGKLGVQGGGMNLKVVINNNNGSEVSQQISTGSDGMKQLEIFIDSRVRKTVGGDIASGEGLGKVFKAMGVAPQGVR